ncbi:MAG: hypothetical protein LBT66_07515 [Methanobrevibacter sp.]|jgi:hypothetical protein|nr:hypothetical protein [Candidatus Methanovirga meridionalis]
MKFKESSAMILILIAILGVYFVSAAEPAYVHIVSVTNQNDGLHIYANITKDEAGTTLLSDYGLSPKYTTLSSIGQPSSAGSAYTQNGTIEFVILNCHTYNYNSITVSFDDYYPGNYYSVNDTWNNNMSDGPNINATPTVNNESVVIQWQVGIPIFVNDSDIGGTNTTVNVTVTNDDNGTNTSAIENITFNDNETTNDTSKINSNGTKNGTTILNLPPGNYTGQVIVTGNSNEDRKGSSSDKFNFTIKGHKIANDGVPLEKTGLPTYSLIGLLLSILLFFQYRIRNK